MLKNSFFRITTAILGSSVLFMAVSFLGSYSMSLKIILGVIIYFLSTFYLASSNFFKSQLLSLAIPSLPLLLALVYFNIFHFNATWISLPSQIFLLLGAISGLLFYRQKSYFIPLVFCVLVIAWVGWLKKLYEYKFIFNSFTGNVSFPYPAVNLYDSTGLLSNLDRKGKLYIIDFWGSSCAPCFREFPEIDKVNKMADKNRYEIITVNIPLPKEKKEDNYALLSQYNYSFKKLFAEAAGVADSFGINGFPTTIVVKNQEVIFRGEFEDAIRRFNVTH